MNKLIDDFQQNFLDESRWHYLTNGLKTTLIITFFAVILGFVLGFLVAIVRSTHDKTATRVLSMFTLPKITKYVIRS